METIMMTTCTVKSNSSSKALFGAAGVFSALFSKGKIPNIYVKGNLPTRYCIDVLLVLVFTVYSCTGANGEQTDWRGGNVSFPK